MRHIGGLYPYDIKGIQFYDYTNSKCNLPEHLLQHITYGFDTPTRKVGAFCSLGKLGFDKAWEWLMPVVIKIETIDNGSYGFTIDPWGMEIIEYASGN